MKITEEENPEPIKIKKTKQTIDQPLGVPEPFPDKPSVIVISAAMGMGKTTLLNSLMTGEGKARVYRNVFDKVFYITPKEVMDSEENHPFKDHPKDRIFHNLDPDTLEKISEEAIKVKDEDGSSALIIDDMSEYLKNKSVEIMLKKLFYKHRHMRLQIILSSLNLKSIPKQLRNLIDIYIIFKPRSKIEIESITDDIIDLGKDDVKQLFDYVYDKPFNFLMYNSRTNTYYKNFNKLDVEE